MGQKQINLLLVEDQEDFACVIRDVLGEAVGPRAEHAEGRFTITHVDRLAAAREKLASGTYDALLLDLNLPDSRGLNTCSAIQAVAPSVPVVVLTGMDDENLALQSVAMGVQDYIVKGRVDWWLVARIIRHAIERKRSELALREREEFFRLISENIGDLIVVLDLEGRRLYNSPSYRAILGDPEKLVGTDSFAEIHPDDAPRIRAVFAETVQTGVGQRAEYRLLLPDGTIRHIESRGNVIRDSQGAVVRVVVVSRDVTEQKAAMQQLHEAMGELNRSHEQLKTAQNQLVQTEKLQAVSTFAAGVAHEVMNPLQAISLGIEFLSQFRVSDDSNASKVLSEMTSAIQRADAVIRGLIDFSAFHKPETKFENLNQIVRVSLITVDTELQELGIETRFDPDPAMPLIRVEERTVRHLLINLFMHSMAVMPEGGCLEVRTRLRVESTGAASWLHGANEFAEIEVRDSGAALLGDPYLRTTPRAPSPSGHTVQPTALSLAVLRRIVELCGGELRIVSEPGFGNRFLLRFEVGARPEP
jgi:PAS domain S-box-containing protein